MLPVAALALLVLAEWHGPAVAQSPAATSLVPVPPATELERRVDEAFIATFPVYEMARTRYNAVANPRNPSPMSPNGAPIHRRGLIDHTARQVTTPNNDTLYSAAWLDLRATPVRVHVPRVDGDRYWSVALLDIWTDNVAVFGRRQDGDGPVDVVVVGPDWKGPPPRGRLIRAPSNDVQLLGRFLVGDAADAPAIHRLQDGIGISPIDAEAPSLPQWLAVSASTDPVNFLAVVNEFLARNPVPAPERARYRRWRDLGLGGGPDAFIRTSPEVQAAWWTRLPVLHEGLKTGLRYESHEAGGWAVPSVAIGAWRGNEPLRAAVALGGLGALPSDEAVYLTLDRGPDGAVLTGARRWKLIVPPIEAKAFWSVSMYEKGADGRLFFTDNPIHRYAVGDRTPGLRRGADGSLELLLQHAPPPDTSHWLPAPAGEWALVLRAYLPSAAFRHGDAPLPRLVPAD